MAVTTLTASAFLAQPKQVHTGLQCRRLVFNSGATAFGTAGDVCYLAKIPNRATVVGCRIFLSSGAAGSIANVIVTKGKTASATTTLAVLGSFTTSAALARFDMGSLGIVGSHFQVSLSDDDGVQYAVLKLHFTAGTSATASVSLEGVVTWAMDAEG